MTAFGPYNPNLLRKMLEEILHERRTITDKLEQRLKALVQTQDWRDPEGILAYLGFEFDSLDDAPEQLVNRAKEISVMLRDERFTEDQVDNYLDVFYRWKRRAEDP